MVDVGIYRGAVAAVIAPGQDRIVHVVVPPPLPYVLTPPSSMRLRGTRVGTGAAGDCQAARAADDASVLQCTFASRGKRPAARRHADRAPGYAERDAATAANRRGFVGACRGELKHSAVKRIAAGVTTDGAVPRSVLAATSSVPPLTVVLPE